MASGGPFGGFSANFNFNGTLLPADGTCGSLEDTTPDSFSFTRKISATLGATITSTDVSPTNSITVSGLGADESPVNSARTAPVTITGTGAEYSKNGGAWTAAAGTASNSDTFIVRGTAGAANGMTNTVTLTIGGASGSFAISTPPASIASGSNFTMLDSANGVTGGTNDVVASWDGSSCVSSTSSTSFDMTLSSTTPFSSFIWTAHHIRVFCPGTYTIDVECTASQFNNGSCATNADPSKNYTFTVGAGQFGAHMLFNWNNATNIDVVQVWNQSAVFSPSPMHTGKGACNSALTTWDLMSTDWDGDGKNGGAMIDGPFTGFSANFNVRLTGTPLACSDPLPIVNVSDPSGAGGCSIGSRPSNGIERGDWWLVAGFLAWLGGIRARLKRKAIS
jgi:hypothetical protein